MGETAIAKAAPVDIVMAAAGSRFSREQVGIIKAQIMPQATDEQLAFFIEYAIAVGLDPIGKQIHAIPRFKDSRIVGYDPFTGIDGLRLIAERTGEYLGSSIEWCGVDRVWHDVWVDDKTLPTAARATVLRLDRPALSRTVKMRDFAKTNSKGELQAGSWTDRPSHMLGKCAEAAALRAAFPRETRGIGVSYDEPTNPGAPATDRAKAKLAILANELGWDDATRRQRAGVASFRDLTRGQAHALIESWTALRDRMHDTGESPDSEILVGAAADQTEAAGGSSAVGTAEAGPDAQTAASDPPPPAAEAGTPARRTADKTAAKSESSRSDSDTPPPHAFIGQDPEGACDVDGCGYYLEAAVHQGQSRMT